MSGVHETTRDSTNSERLVKGCNALFGGDVFQLDPTDDVPLNAVPAAYVKRARDYMPGAKYKHGISLALGADRRLRPGRH